MTVWFNDCNTFQRHIPSRIFDWLTKAKKITPNIKLMTDSIKVEIIQQSVSIPMTYEAERFGDEKVFVREIFICDKQNPLSFGRVCVPMRTYSHFKTLFDQLGNKPIGETILYKRKDVLRSSFKFAKLTNGDDIYIQISKNCTLELSSDLFARYSIFYIDEKPLMITEVILPTIPEFPVHAPQD